MNRLIQCSAVLAFAAGTASTVCAQVPTSLPNPDLQNRIPAPLPPPPQPPVINGPLSQSPPPTIYQPQQRETRQDRTTRCTQEGSEAGLTGGKLDAYTRRCAN